MNKEIEKGIKYYNQISFIFATINYMQQSAKTPSYNMSSKKENRFWPMH